MKNIFKRSLLLFFAVLSFSLYAETTPIKDLHVFTLENGLKIFVKEDKSVPLAYIEIAFRSGSIHQKKENAGLFHLFEHLLFCGNELYPDADSMKEAMKNLGVADNNGFTSTDCMAYFFTIPSDRLEEGLAFWNAAVRSSNFGETEFAQQKEIVSSEISGDHSNPGRILSAYLSRTLCPEDPWKADVSGSVSIIKNATVEQMNEIKERFYIPSNAALFVGGDVDAESVRSLAEKIFGTWSNNGFSAPEKQDRFIKKFSEPKLAVYPYPMMSDKMFSVSVYYPGPRADNELSDYYISDYLEDYFGDPESPFRKILFSKKNLEIPDLEYPYAGATPGRTQGCFCFGSRMYSPERDPASRGIEFCNAVNDSVLPLFNEKEIWSKAKLSEFIESKNDSAVLRNETASSLLSSLRSSWVYGDENFLFSYEKECSRITRESVREYAAKYFSSSPIVIVLMNPNVYEKTKDEFAEKGYEVISKDNAWWWMNAKLDPPSAGDAKVSGDKNIYVPQAAVSSEKQSRKRDIMKFKLKNSMNVYFEPSSSDVLSLGVVVKGGITKLSKETAGMEDSLIDMMNSSSKKYSKAAREAFCFDTQTSFSSGLWNAGSVIYFKTIGKYFDKSLDILYDGFINPSYEEPMYLNYLQSLEQYIHSRLNRPESLAFETAMKGVFEGHPFEVRSSVTEESLPSISRENMEKLHRRILSEDDIAIVVTGNISRSRLLSKLNATFGKMNYDSSRNTGNEAARNVPPLSLSKKNPVVVRHPSSAGTATAIKINAICADTDPDFIPCRLASEIFSDILYNLVRENYGACYTPSSLAVSSPAGYAVQQISRISAFGDFAKYVSEAEKIMADGKFVKKLNRDMTYEVAPLEESLESFKNMLINSTFLSESSSVSKVRGITRSLLYYDDVHHGEDVVERIREVTCDDIRRVFRKYWVDGNSQWYAVTGENEKLKF